MTWDFQQKIKSTFLKDEVKLIL